MDENNYLPDAAKIRFVLTDCRGNYKEVNIDIQSVEVIIDVSLIELETYQGIYNLLNCFRPSASNYNRQEIVFPGLMELPVIQYPYLVEFFHGYDLNVTRVSTGTCLYLYAEWPGIIILCHTTQQDIIPLRQSDGYFIVPILTERPTNDLVI
jgi:hypothetical protein